MVMDDKKINKETGTKGATLLTQAFGSDPDADRSGGDNRGRAIAEREGNSTGVASPRDNNIVPVSVGGQQAGQAHKATQRQVRRGERTLVLHLVAASRRGRWRPLASGRKRDRTVKNRAARAVRHLIVATGRRSLFLG